MHVREAVPLHGAPPLDGSGLVQVRVCLPPPHDLEQLLHDDQLPSTGHAWLLHARDLGPAQSAPPPEGLGLVQVRVWLPPPQLAEQVPQEE